MYLKSLVLKGFKSFADRSVLSLEPGITAIVGPNGSGKSNISDAVLWVLGERNAKHLRGQAMEDVIFAGSSARKATGLAEVDLVLDNSDGTLPIDYSEVAITRRMYRSGESEYLINGTVARRMDVLDILHDSGLGTGTHSIISQGSLDSILQSKPEDRRALIEEAAGVLKHKQRKAKSERKLEQMDQHLARARDVVAEVERQLGPLERKAKRARAYQGLAAELSDAEPAAGGGRPARAAAQMGRGQHARTNVGSRAGRASRRHSAGRGARRGAAGEDPAAKAWTRASWRAGTAWPPRPSTASTRPRWSCASAAAAPRRARPNWKCRWRRTRPSGPSPKGTWRRLARSWNRYRASAAAPTPRPRGWPKRPRRSPAGAPSWNARRPSWGGRAGSWTPRWTPRGASRRRRRRPFPTGSRTSSSSRATARNWACSSNARNRTPRRWRRPPPQANRRSPSWKGARPPHGRAWARRSRRARRRAARRTRRATRNARWRARSRASRRWSARAPPPQARRCHGLLEHEAELQAGLAPLAHAVSAPCGKEALVEHLLGPDVTALLVADAARAREVAQALSESGKAGEVSLVLCEDAAGCAEGACPARAAAAHGTPLVDQLSFPEDAARAVRALLGDVVLCDNLDDALEGHARDAAGLRFATPDGCIVWPSGKVTLGATAAEDEEGALARARRLEDARVRHGAAQEALRPGSRGRGGGRRGAAQGPGGKPGAQPGAGAEAGRRRRGPRRGRPRRGEAGRGAARAGGRGAPARRRRAVHRRDPSERGRPCRARGRPCAGAGGDQGEACGRRRTPSPRCATRRGAASEALSEAKLSAATLAERETYTSRVRDAREREIKQLADADAEARATLRKKKAAMVRIEPLLAVFEELADSARRWTRDLEDQATAAQDSTSGLHAAANEARAAARQAQAAFDAANERMSAARVDKGRLEVQVEAAVNVIVHDCKTPLETALALPELEDRAEAEGTAFKLRRRIANMGTINPDAADEYEELKRRYDYLAGQLADLDGARRTLAKINRVIDARMKDDFVRTYEAVDKNFQEIFGVLFPGGSAHLSLVDPDDLENTGVEVSAQPRGKRITKMMLMSGGEKSLTALALLFAVYRIRATPFYILDEVEAALDDSNLRRLASYIDSLRDRTQLIMITHQRRTMEMADVLFGVSMQADGVTKVISQKLEHALQHAE